MTPILLALKVKGYDRVLLLVDRGADLTQADGKGETPLSLLGPAGLNAALAAAVEGGQAKAVAALVEHGADLSTTTEDGKPLLSLLGPAGLEAALAGAVEGGHPKAVATLERALVEMGAAEPTSVPLWVAAKCYVQRGVLRDVVEATLRARADAVLEVDEHGDNVLHCALKHAHKPAESLELVDQLVTSCPAACEAQNADGNLPVHVVLSRGVDQLQGKSAVVERLLRAFPGACKAKNADGKYPLELAIDKEAEDSIIESLIRPLESENGIDTVLYEEDGRTCKIILRGAALKRFRDLAETYGIFLGLYLLGDTVVHISATCVVIFAKDKKTNKMVALKFMANEEEWLREQEMRTVDGEKLDARHVVQLLDARELDEDPSAMDGRLKGAGRYLLVMEKAQHDLSDALSHYQIAGRDRAQVFQILHQVAGHLAYLNEGKGRIHGDIKPRNIIFMLVETAHGTIMAWVLIDLDASCEIGAAAGQKVTSSAFFPPELARQHLAQGRPARRETELIELIEVKQTELDVAMKEANTEAVVCLSTDVKKLSAELRYAGSMEPVLASAQLEFWYFGCLLYQLCTQDGATLWDANQADNIDEEQLRQLAYQWPEHRAAKLRKIVSDWSDAAHLADWLLQENPAHRPQSWDQVMRHPAFASVAGPATRKRVVMSCPEMGTLDEDGGVARMEAGADAKEVYNQDVMEKVSELQRIGFVKFGFDRAGTSTAVETIEEKKKWSKAFDGTLVVTKVGATLRSLGLDPTETQLQSMIDEVDTDGQKVKSDSGSEITILAGTIDFPDFCTMVRKVKDLSGDDLKQSFEKFAQATPEDVKKLIFKSTDWWYGYQTSVKQAVKLESQGFDGILDVICIRGGAITRLEAEEMGRIMQEAKRDCAKSGISVKYEISYVSYRDLVLECEPWCLEHELLREGAEGVQNHGDAADLAEAATQNAAVVDGFEEVAVVEDLQAALARKDQELQANAKELHANANELQANAKELQAKDEELQELRAQLARFESVPPA